MSDLSRYSHFDEPRMKHLELIQGVISRLGSNSFLVKGWAITVSGAFIGFAVTETKWGLALVSLVPTLLFWGLDGYYLRYERIFRALYNDVRTKDIAPFSMDVTGVINSHPTLTWKCVFFSITLNLFYGLLIVTGLAVAAVVC
jgi:hypothetical protein